MAEKYLENDESIGYQKIDHFNPELVTKISTHYKQIINLVGEDSEREGLLKTPERAAKAIQFLTNGYDQDPEKILRSALFTDEYRQMVLIKDIEIYSMCEHHLLPFFGKAHIAYIPNGSIVGLSKIPRVVDAFARRLQVQERLTMDISCLLYTSDAADERSSVDLGGRRSIKKQNKRYHHRQHLFNKLICSVTSNHHL